MKHKLLLLASLLGLCQFPLAAQESLTLEAYLQEVSTRNLSNEASREMAQGAAERPSQMSAWEDPMMTLAAKRRDDTTLFDSQENELMLSQKIPLWGRNYLEKSRARAEASALEAQADETWQRVQMQARESFFKLHALREKLRLTGESLAIVSRSETLMRERLSTGRANVSQLFMIQTERVMLSNEQTMAKRDEQAALIELNTLRNRALEEPAITIAPTVAPEAMPLTLAQALEKAALCSPKIKEALAQQQSANSKISMANRAYLPDPTVSVTLRNMPDSSQTLNSYDTAISFELPWASPLKYSAQKREARHALRAAEASLKEAQLALSAEVYKLYATISATRNSLALTQNELLPLAHKASQAALIELENGEGDVLSLLAALKRERELSLQLVEAQSTYATQIAQLDVLTHQR